MFDKDSRYAKLPVKVFTDAAGRQIPYVARRIISPPRPPVAQARVQPGDRLDLIAHRAVGVADQFWRIADANPTPDELTSLTAPPGRKLNLNLIEPE